MRKQQVKIPKYRYFSGQRYQRAYTLGGKVAAKLQAKELRRIGSLARVVKYGNQWVVYARR